MTFFSNNLEDNYSSGGNSYDEEGANRRRGGTGYPGQGQGQGQPVDQGGYGTGIGQSWSPGILGLGLGLGEGGKPSYTRDFGTYIGRLKPQAHGIAGLVSGFENTVRIQIRTCIQKQ